MDLVYINEYTGHINKIKQIGCIVIALQYSYHDIMTQNIVKLPFKPCLMVWQQKLIKQIYYLYV